MVDQAGDILPSQNSQQFTSYKRLILIHGEWIGCQIHSFHDLYSPILFYIIRHFGRSDDLSPYYISASLADFPAGMVATILILVLLPFYSIYDPFVLFRRRPPEKTNDIVHVEH